MNVGFYYHVPAAFGGEDGVRLPAHLGRFVAELAARAGRITLYAHSSPVAGIEDFPLPPASVKAIDLGPRRSFPARTFVPASDTRAIDAAEHALDVLLVRGPTPLLPRIVRTARCPVALLLIGDYRGWSPTSSFPWWRNRAIGAWVALYSALQRRAAAKTLVLANSPELVASLASEGVRAHEVFTSSLSEQDLVGDDDVRWAAHKGTSEPIRLLFSGRFVEEKGLTDAVEALAILVERGTNVTLELIGWADDPSFLERLRRDAERRGVGDRLVVSGYRRPGPELVAAYRGADIVVSPARHEGFPRSVVEALAAGVPVVATRVGGVDHRLDDGKTALLVEPGSATALAAAIERLRADEALRHRLSRAGRVWARQFTNERSCAMVLEHLRTLTDRGAHVS